MAGLVGQQRLRNATHAQALKPYGILRRIPFPTCYRTLVFSGHGLKAHGLFIVLNLPFNDSPDRPEPTAFFYQRSGCGTFWIVVTKAGVYRIGISGLMYLEHDYKLNQNDSHGQP